VWIKRLFLSNFRNFSHFSLDFSSEVTLIYGENGSGKSSILEALALFGLGRSFRGSKIKGLTKIGEKKHFQVGLSLDEPCFGDTNNLNPPNLNVQSQCLSVEDEGYPHRLRFRVNEIVTSAAEVINKVPLQLLSANSFQILEAGSTHRRQLLDWGCFFQTPIFVRAWRRYSGILKQRNALLRGQFGGAKQHQGVWEAWDRAFLEAAQAVEALRRAYWSVFEPMVIDCISQFLPGLSWRLAYLPGWPVEEGLDGALRGRFVRDCALGHTSVGPHRADLDIFIGEQPAKQVLSRGQTKLLICALLMARARVLFEQKGRSCVFLIDDADAELDSGALDRLFEGLQGLGVQWVATSVRPEGPWASRGAGSCVLLPQVALSAVGA
jgi:DNA replication and repair protein RecF